MKHLFLIFALLLSCTDFSWSQEHALDTLLQRFRNYREQAMPEKMYAHLDRTFYLTGETIWFRVITVDGNLHHPLDVSKVAYAEILDKSNTPVTQGKVALTNGFGNGSFFLPASLASGHYTFRLYTSWMKNFDPALYFTQSITIANPFVAPSEIPAKSDKKITASFFPEGGNLVAGIRSRVGFRVNGDAGSIKGFVISDNNDTLARFAPLKFGLGSFYFTPPENIPCRAVITEGNGTVSVHELPRIYPGGYVLHLSDSGAFLRVTVTSKKAPPGPVFLFVHARQMIGSAQTAVMRHGTATFIIEKSAVAGGVSHLTVFNQQLQPVCERLWFSKNIPALDIVLEGVRKKYGTREKVSVTVHSAGGDGSPRAANMSVSVHKVDSLTYFPQTNIGDYWWLLSDLTGTVESPGYYFSQESDTTVAATDNLMLTHGWRRFNWDDVLALDQGFTFLPEVRGPIVTAVVTRDNIPQPSTFTLLSAPGKIIRVYGSWTNRDGVARYELKDCYGARSLFMQVRSDSAYRYKMSVEDPFSQKFDRLQLPEYRFDMRQEKELLSRSIAMQVQDIFYFDELSARFTPPLVDSSAFYGKADDTYLLDDYTRFPVMEEVMREYVPGVFVRKRKDGFHFIVADASFDGVLPGDPLVLVDGVPVADVDEVMQLDPLRVRKLEVVKRKYFLGQGTFSGIVSYSTYAGDLGGLALNPDRMSIDFEGLQLQREFFSPDHAGNTPAGRLPDQRFLLHWAPELLTDASGRGEFSFFTSDVPGIYRIVVQGVSPDGLAATGILTFTVGEKGHP